MSSPNPSDDCCSSAHPRGVFICRVVANEPICREHYRLTLALPWFPSAQPGQFVHIRCTEPNDLGWTGGAFIRRPFSIGGLRRSAKSGNELPQSNSSQGVEIDILHRAIGIGTQWLARLGPGDEVNLLGPLGQPFRLPLVGAATAGSGRQAASGTTEQTGARGTGMDVLEARPTPDDRQDAGTPGKLLALLVGGGIGLPPLIWLAEALRAAGVPAIAFAGARTVDSLPLTLSPCTGATPVPQGPLAPRLFCEEFSRVGVPGIVATDDGSLGAKGLLPEVLDAWLDRNPDQARSAVVYTCGPDRMMRAVAAVCRQRELACQVCLERMMACGMGTCQSCVVRIRDESAAEGWRYRLCCSDGPVFDARDVLWG